MPAFLWEATSRKGEQKKGELDAADEATVRAQLRRQGFKNISVKAKPKDLMEYLPFLQQSVKEKDVVVFSRIFSTMINFTWWPTAGEAYLLPSLAAVFVGGTPTWGGIGTVLGGAFGGVIVSFIQVGIVSAGLDGFYVQFFNGLIIILSLIGHRWNQIRYR